MTLDEITQYANEQSVRGDLAREFVGILSDYQAGTITAEEKNQLVNEVLAAYKAQGLAEDEVMFRWAFNAASIAVSIV